MSVEKKCQKKTPPSVRAEVVVSNKSPRLVKSAGNDKFKSRFPAFSGEDTSTAATTVTPAGDEFVDWIKENGGVTLLDDDKERVKSWVRKNLFPKLKFIMNDAELQYTGMSVQNMYYLQLFLLKHACENTIIVI